MTTVTQFWRVRPMKWLLISLSILPGTASANNDSDLIAQQTIDLKATCGRYDEKCLAEIENEIQAISDLHPLMANQDPVSQDSSLGLPSSSEASPKGQLVEAVDGYSSSGVKATTSYPTSLYGCYGGVYNPVCKNTGVYKVYRTFIAAYANKTYVIQTSDLKQMSGQSNTPDTVIRVIDENAGTLIAVNDDWANGSFASKVSFTVTEDKFVTILVHGYMGNNHGTCDITLKEDGQVLLSLNDQTFGGWQVLSKNVRQGDQIFVGKNTNQTDIPYNPSTYSDSTLYLFNNSSLNCSSGSCGLYTNNDDDIGTLSRIYSAPWTATAASILVGAYANDAVLNARLFHVRKSGWGTPSCPSSALYSDCDGDGLSREIESVLGTCDDSSGPSINCSSTNGRKFASYASFSPEDSDSDGASDFAEIYGLKKQCQRTPASPLWDAGICTDASLNPNCSYCQKLPLSTMDNPDPTVYDIFIHIASTSDPLGLISGSAHDHTLSATSELYLKYTLSQEPVECRDSNSLVSSGTCPLDAGSVYPTSIHFFRSAPASGEILYQDYPLHGAATLHNKFFPSSRRYSGVFRFLSSDHYYGVSFAGGYAATFQTAFELYLTEISDHYYSSAIAAHEIGHLLNTSSDGYIPNRISIGNYFYQSPASMARKGAFPSSFGMTCLSDDDCFPGVCGPICMFAFECEEGDCVAGRCTSGAKTCEVDCGAPPITNHYWIRFSRGGEPELDETQILEPGHSERLATNWWCAEGRYRSGASLPLCQNGVCSIDFDNNSQTPSYPNQTYYHDFGNGLYSVLSDKDEWKQIFDKGKNVLKSSAVSPHVFLAYGTSFSSSGPIDGTGFGTIASGVFSVAGPGNKAPGSVDIDPGYSVSFAGPGSGQFMQIPSSPQIYATGMGVPGIASYLGFSVMLTFRLDSISSTTVSLIRSGHYNVVIDRETTTSGILSAWVNGGPVLGGVGTQNIISNRWYRLIFLVHPYASAGILLAEEDGNGGWSDWVVLDANSSPTGANDPGIITVGSDSNHQQTLDGEIGDLQIWSGPVCAHWFGYDGLLMGNYRICEF